MTSWTGEELERIGGAEELDIAPRRTNGRLQKPVTIWVVRVDNDLFVRSYRGRGSGWFSAALERHEGQISVAGITKEVGFAEESDAAPNDRIDDAYLAKYGRYPQYVAPMVTPEVRATTLKLVPRETRSDAREA